MDDKAIVLEVDVCDYKQVKEAAEKTKPPRGGSGVPKKSGAGKK